jgi:hypothetical protein
VWAGEVLLEQDFFRIAKQFCSRWIVGATFYISSKTVSQVRKILVPATSRQLRHKSIVARQWSRNNIQDFISKEEAHSALNVALDLIHSL